MSQATEALIVVLIYAAISFVVSLFTLVPWLIGLGWMAHHWLGV